MYQSFATVFAIVFVVIMSFFGLVIGLLSVTSGHRYKPEDKKIKHMAVCETDKQCSTGMCMYNRCMSDVEFNVAERMCEQAIEFYEELNESIVSSELLIASYKHANNYNIIYEWVTQAKSLMRVCRFVTRATNSTEDIEVVMQDYEQLYYFSDKTYQRLVELTGCHQYNLKQKSQSLYEIASHLFHMLI